MGPQGLTKKQRIETLEKEVSELKLIVHELRERKPSVFATTVGQDLEAEYAEQVKGEPSTVIEFEGAKYRKVERKAREGDVVIVREPAQHTSSVNINVPYKVVESSENETWINFVHYAFLYERLYGRTPETVDVYELITEPSTSTTVEDEPKSPNQLRAEVIEKAKGFVKQHTTPNSISTEWRVKGAISWKGRGVIPKFRINADKRVIVFELIGASNPKKYIKTHAKCNPSDVFNEHIGRAIALGRALGLDVSEFEQAVQPTLAIGQIVERYHPHSKNYLGKLTVKEIREVSVYGKSISATNTHILNDGPNYGEAHGDKIINDTNAIYEGGTK